jgi:hypothetical protein
MSGSVKTAALIFCLYFIHSASADVLINEFMATNASVIVDEDGDHPDWIEIYNPTGASLNLEDYSISDRGTDLRKWIIPSVYIGPKNYILLFASGKDRKDVYYWENIIDQGDTWRYQPGSAAIPITWIDVSYDDSAWPEGPSGFGFGDGDDATVVSNVISLYIRKTFSVTDVERINKIVLHIDYDDAFVAYLNGREIARANIGSPGDRPAYNQTADVGHEAQMYHGGEPELFEVADAASLISSGNNVLAIEVHNQSASSSDMTVIPFLTVARIGETDHPKPLPEILHLNDSQLHTNFKIKNSGEFLFLTNPQGLVVDSVEVVSMPVDISYGRIPDGATTWHYLSVPTPNEVNIDSDYRGKSDPPIFSRAGGFFNTNVSISLTTDSLRGRIYYTTDGSVPSESSQRYVNPLAIVKTQTIRARCFREDLPPSDVITQTYFVREKFTMPVVSLVTDPYNLWDIDYGIYAMGRNPGNEYPYFSANFWQDWERPVHVEFFETDGSLAFDLDAGMKIYGAWSRARPQKSVAIFARSQYGTGSIDYRIFKDKDIEKFEAFVLRNSGNDWTSTMFRDGFMQALVKDVMDIETMGFRPAICYLNGEYWGILNLREKINEHFLASNRGVDPDNIDLLEWSVEPVRAILGSADSYKALEAYMENNDLSDAAVYEYVKSQVDMDNFIEYMVAEIYFDNTDWPGNNMKCWRPLDPTGKWRWLVFDTDFGFSLYGNNYANNTLDLATAPNGPSWPNPPYSTFLLRKLLENESFRQRFINIFADHLNTTFAAERVLNILDSFREQFEPEIARHHDKWPESAPSWENDINRMEAFARQRVNYMRNFIRNKFGLSGLFSVALNVSDANFGSIKINTRTLSDYPWTGVYFRGVPITLTAIPKADYRFAGWSDGSTAISRIYDQNQNLSLTATFEPGTNNTSDVVINEINYNSSESFNTKDWVEFYNRGESSIDMSQWIFKDNDEDHVFIFPKNSVVPPDGFLVLCRDAVAFRILFDQVEDFVGDMAFDLNSHGELLRLYDQNGVLVDSLSFDDTSPWPDGANGFGYTIELIDPFKDNALSTNWQASAALGGTPGRHNSSFTGVMKNKTTVRSFVLYQNYPNPFNNATQISFYLPHASQVKLTIFDVLGRVVDVPASSQLEAGSHRLTWQSSAPSGVYFYKLEAARGTAKHVALKKMLLLK